MKTYDIKAKTEKPRWYQFRLNLSNRLVWLAKKIYPENPKVYEFFMKQMVDYAIYGGAVTRVDPKDMYKNPLPSQEGGEDV